MLKDSERKEERGEAEVGYDACETPIRTTTQEGINYLLAGGHEVDDDTFPATENKPRPKRDTY